MVNFFYKILNAIVKHVQGSNLKLLVRLNNLVSILYSDVLYSEN